MCYCPSIRKHVIPSWHFTIHVRTSCFKIIIPDATAHLKPPPTIGVGHRRRLSDRTLRNTRSNPHQPGEEHQHSLPYSTGRYGTTSNPTDKHHSTIHVRTSCFKIIIPDATAHLKPPPTIGVGHRRCPTERYGTQDQTHTNQARSISIVYPTIQDATAQPQTQRTNIIPLNDTVGIS
jgi:hypothetical protein